MLLKLWVKLMAKLHNEKLTIKWKYIFCALEKHCQKCCTRKSVRICRLVNLARQPCRWIILNSSLSCSEVSNLPNPPTATDTPGATQSLASDKLVDGFEGSAPRTPRRSQERARVDAKGSTTMGGEVVYAQWCTHTSTWCGSVSTRCRVSSNISDSSVGITPQMCNRVTNPWDMGIFNRPTVDKRLEWSSAKLHPNWTV